MQHFRSTRTGRVVAMPDAKEKQSELEKVRRAGRPLDEGIILLEVKRHKRILSKMEDTYVWEKATAADLKKYEADKAKATGATGEATATTGETGGDGK